LSKRDHLLWSFVATVVLTMTLRLGQTLGVTRMDIPLMLGTMITSDRDRAKVEGSLVHLVNGWLFGAIYIAAFHSQRRSGLVFGSLIGVVHSLAVLTVGLPFLPGAHRRMASDFTGPQPTTNLEPPGFLALNYGRGTPLLTIAAHIIYGGILGFCYRPPKERGPHPDPRFSAAAISSAALIRPR
jgi:hypothetical protein